MPDPFEPMDVDPKAPDTWDKVLWEVHGECMMHMSCLTIRGSGPTVWGYSIYRRQPGFRTLGIPLSDYIGMYPDARFFDDKQMALDYVAYMTEPKCQI